MSTYGEGVSITAEAPINPRWPEYGATADGSPDHEAINAALAAAASVPGGAVYLPAGTYTVDGGLALSATTAKVRMFGDGFRKTVLQREAGTTTLLTLTGDNDAGRVDLCDLTLDGNATAGLLLDVARCNDMLIRDIEVRRSTATGVRMRKVFNSFVHGLMVHSCGNGTTSPAMLLDAFDETQGGCDTVMFIGFQAEGNGGTDMRLTGAQTVNGQSFNAPSSGIAFVGGKMEGGSGTYPYIDLDYAQGTQFAAFRVVRGASRTGVLIQQVGSTSTGTTANAFANCLIDANVGAAQAHYVDQGQGSLIFNALTVLGSPSTAFFRVRSSVNVGRFKLDTGTLVTNVPTNTLVLDERAVPSVTPGSTITLPGWGEQFVSVSASATQINTITKTFRGHVVTLLFPGISTLNDGTGNLRLAGTFTSTVNDSLTLMCDGTDWYEVARSLN